MENLQSWLIGLGAAMAIPLAIRWAKNNLPRLAGNWLAGQIKRGMEGQGMTDAELRELVHEITLALCRFAERKLPDDGLGPQRMEMILAAAKTVPVLKYVVEGREDDWRAIINAVAREWDTELKKSVGTPPLPR